MIDNDYHQVINFISRLIFLESKNRIKDD